MIGFGAAAGLSTRGGGVHPVALMSGGRSGREQSLEASRAARA